jgi:hypothetical protein
MTTTIILTVAITVLLRLWNIPWMREQVFGWVGKLPSALKWIAPVLLGMAAATGKGWLEGLRGSNLFEMAMTEGGEIGAMAIGLWHTAKRIGNQENLSKLLLMAAPKADPPTPS